MSTVLSTVVASSTAVSPHNKKIEFEHAVWRYRLLVPMLYLVGVYVHIKRALYKLFGAAPPSTNFCLVDGISVSSRRVKDGAARWPALECCYNFDQKGIGSNALVRAIDRYWLNIRNAQAVRNRLKVTKKQLKLAIDTLVPAGNPVRLLSLAAGAAQGVIEVIADMRAEGIVVEAILIDQDQTALDYARRLAEQHHVGDAIQAINSDVLFFDRLINTIGFKPDIIEMCGLMDYLHTSLAIKLVRKIYRHLRNGGFFLTCHIHHNHEAYFLKWAVNWWMLYRTKDEIEDIVVEGGFMNVRLHGEPHRIHSVAVAQKFI